MRHLHKGVAALAVALLVFSLVPAPGSSATIDYGGFGTRPVAGDRDFTMQLQDLPSTQIPFLARDDTAGTGTESDDEFYIHFSAATATTGKSVGDIRVAVPSGGTGAAGDLLTASTATGTYDAIFDLDDDATEGNAGDAIDGFIRFLEMDGKPGFSTADWLYIDADDDGALSAGDIRLSTPSTSGTSASGVSVTASDRYVSVLDDDYAEAAAATEDNLPNGLDFDTSVTFDVRFHDADHDGRFDSGDTLVAVASDSPSQNILGMGHVFLSKSGSRTHGNHASASESSTRPLFHALAATDAYLVTTSDSGDPWLFDLYIHFGSPGGEPSGTPDCDAGPVASAATGDLGHIQSGDVILRKGATGTNGAAASYMTRVTSESNGAGMAIKGCAPLAENIYYIDHPDGNTGYTSVDFLYLNIPNTGFGGTDDANDGLDINDLRMARMTFGTTFNAGTTVRTGNQDLTSLASEAVNPGSHSTPWQILHRDLDRSQGLTLQTLSNAKYNDTNNDNLWDPATEAVYVSTNGTVWDGDLRIWEADTTETGSTPSTFTTVSCPGDADCGAPIEANTDIKVTGPDTAWDEEQSEVVVWSPDSWATPDHDRAISPYGGLAGGALLTAATATSHAWSNSGDTYYFQWDEAAAPNGPLSILRVHDVKWASTPTWVGPKDADHVPTLQRLPPSDNALTLLDMGTTNPTSDGYYLRLASDPGENLQINDLRLTPTTFSSGGNAGNLLASSNTLETSSSQWTDSASELEDRVFFFDDGSSGLDPGDPVYLDLPTDLGGTADNDLSSFDVRLVSVTWDGTTYKPGSFTRTGEKDLSDFGDFTTWPANTGFRLYFFDENRDGSFNADDMLYLVHDENTTTTETTVVPDRLSIRMIGSGGAAGATGGTGGSGGGSTTPPSTPVSTPSASPSPSPSPSPSLTPEPPLQGQLSDANQALGDSLRIFRDGEDNVLLWEQVEGVAGYQIWRYDGTGWERLGDFNDGWSRWTDEAGPEEARYLVTAFLAEDGSFVGAYTSLDGVNVPGLGTSPQGKEPESVPTPSPTQPTDEPDPSPSPTDGDTRTPGIGLVVLLGAVLGLAVLRRRLK